jgi:hypothetical protein
VADDLFRDLAQLLVGVLGLRAQQFERVGGVGAGSGDDDADGLVDDRARQQRGFQVLRVVLPFVQFVSTRV